jgi:DNA transformation protein and related proteins
MTSPLKDRSKPKAVRSLPGFGLKCTLALQAIGITSIEQLRSLDPYEVYAQLRVKVPGTSRNFLYGLIGAIEQCDWREVAKMRRTEILMRLDDMGLAPK